MIVKLPEQEGPRVEFKQEWSETAKKTLIAFANTLGGEIYFGLSDDGVATGLSKKQIDMISRSILQFCRTGTEPVMTDLIALQVIPVGADGYILKVTVCPGDERPYAFKGRRYTGGAYVRDGSMSVTANETEIHEMLLESIPVPWEKRLSRIADLSFDAAAGIFSKYGVPFSPAYYLRLGLVDDKGNGTKLGELISDQNPSLLVVGTFAADTGSLSVRKFSGSLLSQIDQAFEMFAAINPELIEKTDNLANKRRFGWPPRALREALVNCAVHRDYSESEPTKVSVFPDRFEFLSYGSIPGRLSIEDIVLEGVSKCRNERLADIFRRLGWMENYGSGFPMIWREYANSGYQPKLEATRRVFRITLPKIQTETAFSLNERCLALFQGNDVLSMPEVVRRLEVSRTSAYEAVRGLIREGKVEKIGSGRMTRYRSLVR